MSSSSDHDDLPAASSSDSEEDHPMASARMSNNESTSNNESASKIDCGDSQTEGNDQVITDPKIEFCQELLHG
jgi:hypothetical protein